MQVKNTIVEKEIMNCKTKEGLIKTKLMKKRLFL